MHKILIIDDEEGVRITLKKIMEREGYDVDTAGDFEEALQLLDKNQYDTAVTDILLPGFNGIELLKSIREKCPDLPVIVITGEPNLETATESIRHAAYDYIAKPVTKDNLPPVIARSVEKKTLIDEKKRLEKENLEYQWNLEKRVKERTKEIEALNEQLMESQSKLIQSERLATLGTFVSFVSHELRNPLSIIQASIYYLRGHIASENPKVEKHFRIISEEVDIANKIIEDFLAFSKGKPLDLESVNFKDLIHKVMDMIRIPETVKLLLNMQEGLKDISIDRGLIQQVLVNLIKNAIEAMPQGGTLTLGVRQDEKYGIIDINDTGVGISEDDLDRLFNPFFTRKEKGTGLGLVICEFLVKRHNGRIMVKSALGKGSTFSIYFPLKR